MALKSKTPAKFHIKTGDNVIVISGDEKGKKGKVTKVIVEKQRAIVEGLNTVKKHVKPSAQKPEGGIITMEASMHISNLMVLDPKTGEPTRTGRKLNKENKLQRFTKKSGEFVA
jgi:large subunit ribosomal protein L24